MWTQLLKKLKNKEVVNYPWPPPSDTGFSTSVDHKWHLLPSQGWLENYRQEQLLFFCMKNGWEKGRLWWQKKGSNDHVAHLKWQNCTAIYKRHYSKPLSTITSLSCINKSCDNSIKWLWKENIGSEKKCISLLKKKKKKSTLAAISPSWQGFFQSVHSSPVLTLRVTLTQVQPLALGFLVPQ